MKRDLIPSSLFLRAVKKALKKNLISPSELEQALSLLQDDMFNHKLKTHKLHGNLIGSFASSNNYEIRIIFQIVLQNEKEYILLETIGNHDEVY